MNYGAQSSAPKQTWSVVLNIIDWAKTAKQTTPDEGHEAPSYGFDFIIEHADGSWIGIVDQPTDYGLETGKPTNYWVTVGNNDEFFEHLTDAQVFLWNGFAKPAHENGV
jgi:hypothetical protein